MYRNRIIPLLAFALMFPVGCILSAEADMLPDEKADILVDLQNTNLDPVMRETARRKLILIETKQSLQQLNTLRSEAGLSSVEVDFPDLDDLVRGLECSDVKMLSFPQRSFAIIEPGALRSKLGLDNSMNLTGENLIKTQKQYNIRFAARRTFAYINLLQRFSGPLDGEHGLRFSFKKWRDLRVPDTTALVCYEDKNVIIELDMLRFLYLLKSKPYMKEQRKRLLKQLGYAPKTRKVINGDNPEIDLSKYGELYEYMEMKNIVNTSNIRVELKDLFPDGVSSGLLVPFLETGRARIISKKTGETVNSIYIREYASGRVHELLGSGGRIIVLPDGIVLLAVHEWNS